MGLFPIWMFIFLNCKYNQIDSPVFQQKYSNLTHEMLNKLGKPKTYSVTYYYFLFWEKRMAYVMIVVFTSSLPCIQLQVLLMMFLFHTMIYMSDPPHFQEERYYIEYFNEIVIMFGLYHFIMFSNFNLSLQKVENELSLSFATGAALLLVVHLGLLVKAAIALRYNTWRL